MVTSVAEIEALALEMSQSDRAHLASRLLRSLPPPSFENDDDLVAEAERRDREMDKDPSRGMSIDELDELIANRRR